MNKLSCVFCSKSYLYRHKLEVHFRTHTNERPFPCTLCGKSFRENGVLMTHINTHKKTEKPHKCNQCPLAFSLEVHLKNHLINVHNVLNLPSEKCPTCGKVFKNGTKLKGHQLRVHTESEKPHECLICGKWFKIFSEVLHHISTHTREKPFSCPKCPANFSYGSQRRSHLIRRHNIGVRLRCPVCSKSMCAKSELEIHMRIHTNEKPFSCSTCSKTCSTAQNLKCHMRVHAPEKPYCCNICGKRYSNLAAYKLHLQRHKGDYVRNHKCVECPISFYAEHTLKRHVKFVHRQERPFSCNICGRGFQTPNNRDRHINTHLKETQYKCKICGKILNSIESLTRHMNTAHSNSKGDSYPCSKCAMSFKSELDFSRHYLLEHVGSQDNLLKCFFCDYHVRSLRDLERHYTKHTGERPYYCSKCPQSFGRSDNLSLHLRSFHS